MILTECPSKNNNLKSYIDGQQFKNHAFFMKYPNALRLTVYFDDVEITNPLGTKCKIHEIGAFYFTIQNCHQYFNSNVNNIIIFTIANTLDIKKYGFEKILNPLMKEIQKLESNSGVEIDLVCFTCNYC